MPADGVLRRLDGHSWKVLMENTNSHAGVSRRPPPVPPGFSADSFFAGVHWHQRWEIFKGIFVPGRNTVRELCDLIGLPPDLSGSRVLDVERLARMFQL